MAWPRFTFTGAGGGVTFLGGAGAITTGFGVGTSTGLISGTFTGSGILIFGVSIFGGGGILIFGGGGGGGGFGAGSTFGCGGSVSSVSFLATMGLVFTIIPKINTSAAIVQLMMMAVTVAPLLRAPSL